MRLLEATHPERAASLPRVARFVRFGASPRGAQAMLLTAKAHAVFEGRFSVSTDDVRAVIERLQLAAHLHATHA